MYAFKPKAYRKISAEDIINKFELNTEDRGDMVVLWELFMDLFDYFGHRWAGWPKFYKKPLIDSEQVKEMDTEDIEYATCEKDISSPSAVEDFYKKWEPDIHSNIGCPHSHGIILNT